MVTRHIASKLIVNSEVHMQSISKPLEAKISLFIPVYLSSWTHIYSLSIRCSYDGKYCPNGSLTTSVNNFGVCFTFNSGESHSILTSERPGTWLSRLFIHVFIVILVIEFQTLWPRKLRFIDIATVHACHIYSVECLSSVKSFLTIIFYATY